MSRARRRVPNLVASLGGVQRTKFTMARTTTTSPTRKMMERSISGLLPAICWDGNAATPGRFLPRLTDW